MKVVLNSPLIMWFIIINLVCVAVCIADKIKAKRHSRRISEKTLFTLSFLGGSLFMYITMRLLRHKTLHKWFMIGLPLIILLHAVLTIALLKYAPYIIVTV